MTTHMQDIIEKAIRGEDLSQAEAREAADAIFTDATDAQIGALLTALRTKGETDEEIAGFAEGMKAAAEEIAPDREGLIDTCGTGGDDHDTINVSTSSAIVAASAGVPVAKHGNYSVSSSSGSADVLEELGVTIDAEPAAVERAIEDVGVGFMLAPVFHPAMKRVIGPRKELGVRTIFNILGPLTNPADADAQVVGVFDPEFVPRMARALARMDVDRALVVHGDGLDEIGLHGETTVAEVEGSDVEEYRIAPDDLGLERRPVEAVSGGGPAENAAILREIFAGDREDARRDIVLANAGAALYVAESAGSIAEGVEIARNAVAEGRPLDTLEEMAEQQ
jgi:anthranilate phosphoribosyltransferase